LFGCSDNNNKIAAIMRHDCPGERRGDFVLPIAVIREAGNIRSDIGACQRGGRLCNGRALMLDLIKQAKQEALRLPRGD
jgi:hypothetical protein